MDHHSQEIQFAEHLLPVIEALKRFHIDVYYSSRNDLMINGFKISGSAQLIKDDKILHHGTFLINGNLSVLQEVLRPKNLSISSRANKSNPSRVINLSTVVGHSIDVDSIKTLFRNAFCDGNKYIPVQLSQEDIEQIKNLMKTKYETWEWNYGISPDYLIRRKKRLVGGNIEILLNVAHGRIEKIRFLGDFFCSRDITVLEEKMNGLKVDHSLYKNLDELEAGSYIYGATVSDIAELILED